MQHAYHTPVLLRESIEGLSITACGGVYVDTTFGGGGHARAILEQLHTVGGGHLYAFDQDEEAMAQAPQDELFTFVRSNFRYLKNWMRYYGVEVLDGLLADLGVSSHHLDEASRGFAFRFEAPLDMRMNRSGGRTAAEIVNEESEEHLADIFHYYGELRQARQLAAAIVKARQQKTIETTSDLLRIIDPLLYKESEKKEQAKAFQALRIEVNHEMEALKEMLSSAITLLKPGGRIVVITYHSVEDRIVKNMLRAGKEDGVVATDFFGQRSLPLRAINKKVIVPSQEEREHNPRSRSAKMRIAEKI